MKVSQQPQKSDPIRFELRPQVHSMYIATRPNSYCYVCWGIKHTVKRLRIPRSGISGTYLCINFITYSRSLQILNQLNHVGSWLTLYVDEKVDANIGIGYYWFDASKSEDFDWTLDWHGLKQMICEFPWNS